MRTAFETARVKDGDEQDFVDLLRKGAGYVRDLALMAEEDGKLVGHIMLTHLPLQADGGRRAQTLLLAPLSVLFEYRSRGIGAVLVNEAIRRARWMGFEAVLLACDPEYCGRFGFTRSDSFGARYGGRVPPQNLLALELRPGALNGTTIELGEGHEGGEWYSITEISWRPLATPASLLARPGCLFAVAPSRQPRRKSSKR